MNFTFYYSKALEEEVRYWMNFLKYERGITTFPDIPAGELKTLAWHDNKEIRVKRIGRLVAQLVIEEFDPIEKRTILYPLYPYVRYWDGEPEDNLVLDQEAEEAFDKEQENLEKLFCPTIREGIVPLA